MRSAHAHDTVDPELPIAVLGAGIGGLATSIALRQQGFRRVTLFERAKRLRPVGAGISLWANALEALTLLGCDHLFEELGWAGTSTTLRTARGRPLTRPLSSQFTEQVGSPALLRTVLRSELQAVLLQRLGELLPGSDESPVLDANCTGFQITSDGVVLTFADGREHHAAIAVGADGVHSVIRHQLHPRPQRSYAGYTAWRAVVDLPASACEPGEAWGRGQRFGQLPVSQHQIYWFATANEPEGARAEAGERAHLLERFASWPEPTRRLIEAADDDRILRNDVYEAAPLSRWGEGPVTLLGDAAHPMSPNLGQGGCQALEDAVVLARCLAATCDPAGLRRYEDLRQPRTRQFVDQSRSIGRVGQLESRLACALRNLAVRAVPGRLQERQLARLMTFNP